MPVANGSQGLNSHVAQLAATPDLPLEGLRRAHGPGQFARPAPGVEDLPGQLRGDEKHQHGEHRPEHAHIRQQVYRQAAAEQCAQHTPGTEQERQPEHDAALSHVERHCNQRCNECHGLRHRLDQVRVTDTEHGNQSDRGQDAAGRTDGREDEPHQPAPGEQLPQRHRDVGDIKVQD
jgi:hypothetical protein